VVFGLVVEPLVLNGAPFPPTRNSGASSTRAASRLREGASGVKRLDRGCVDYALAMILPPKMCPECREEYMHSAELCVHCDVPLVHADHAEEAASSLPPASELCCVRAASVGWATGLSERLRDAGIAHRIQAVGDDADSDGSVARPGQNLPYGVYVQQEDLAAATEIDLSHLSSEIPDLPEGYEIEESTEGACPACGDPVDATASECPGCGLALAIGD
jgi:hypothetical protein